MPLNFSPTGAVERVSFGQGLLFIGATGATPTVDIGFARNSTLTVTRTKKDLEQGVPTTLVRSFASKEDVSLQFTGLEYKLDKIKDLLGSGTYTSAGGSETLRFGGKIDFTEVAVLFRHITPTQGTLDIRIFRAQGQGELTLNFGDDFQEFNYQFRALPATTDWKSAAITADNLIEFYFAKGATT